MATTFVAVGAIAEANNAAVTPALPAGLAAGDLIAALCFYRSGTGTITAPGAPWIEAWNQPGGGSSRGYALYYTRATGSDVAPTFNVTGGADQNTVIGFCFAFRPSAGKALILDGVGAHSPNGSQVNVGPIAIAPVAGSNGFVFVFGAKNAQWTSVATLSGDSLTWAEIVDHESTAWGDTSIAADYAIFSSTPSLTQKTFTAGGGNALGVGRMVTFKEVGLAIGDYAVTWEDWAVAAAGFAAALGYYAATWDDWAVDYTALAGPVDIPPAVGNSAAAWDNWAVAAAATLHPPPSAWREPRPTAGCDFMWAYDAQTLTADLALDRRGSPATSDDLQTAVILSLGSDARAAVDDVIPDTPGSSPVAADRRGWWGDVLPPAALPSDRYGSLLWLLAREKQVPAVLARAEAYAREALAWLIADGIASRVDVAASFWALGWLLLEVAIHRPTAPPARYRFDLAWAAQAARSSQGTG